MDDPLSFQIFILSCRACPSGCLFFRAGPKRRQRKLSSLTVIENKTLTCDRYGTRKSYRKSGTVVTAGVATKIT